MTGGPRTSEAKHTDQKLSQAAAASFEAGWNGALEHVRQQQRTGQAEAGDLLAKAIGYLNRWFDVSYITPNTPLTWHEGDAEVHALVDLLRPASAPGPCPPEAQVNWDAEIEKTTLKRCRTLLRQVFQYFVKGEGGYLVPHTISTELAEQIQMFGGGAPCFPAAYFADIENGTASPDLSDIEMPCAGGCGATTLRGLGLCGKCMAREMVPDPRPTQARSMPEVVAAEDLDGFKRTEPDDDHSTIHCPCGSSFTWTGLDLGLGPWVNKHMPHQQRTTKPVPGRDDFEAKAAEWLKRGNCTKQDCARCISALAAMLRDVYSEGLRDGPRLDADAQRPDYARPKLSPTKTSAEARRRITAKIRPFALDFLNSTDIEDADRVSALVHLLVMVWDEAFETCAAMPCEHDQRSETATPLNHHASCPVHDGGNCACAKGTGK